MWKLVEFQMNNTIYLFRNVRTLSNWMYSTAADNAKILDSDGPDVSLRIMKTFLKMERISKNEFRSVHLLKGRQNEPYIYGGQVFTHALKSASQTVDSRFYPHSMHSYFIKAGSVFESVHYHVEIVRDGKSFSTRSVKATQNNDLLFISQISFHKEEKSDMYHQTKCILPPGPDGLLNVELIKNRIAEESGNTDLAQLLSPTFHRIFEVRPVDNAIYEPNFQELKTPGIKLWIRPTIAVGKDYCLQRLLAAYMSDSSMVETAVLPHIANGFTPGMVFSLDHCIWFHRPQFIMDNWMLLEQYSDYAGGNRTHTRARLWTHTGDLVVSAVQEGLVREARTR